MTHISSLIQSSKLLIFIINTQMPFSTSPLPPPIPMTGFNHICFIRVTLLPLFFETLGCVHFGVASSSPTQNTRLTGTKPRPSLLLYRGINGPFFWQVVKVILHGVTR